MQNLLGLQGFTTYGLKTTGGELVFFSIQPTNISVLSPANIEIKIQKLLVVLTSQPWLEVICMDSAQRFDDNQQFMEQRIRQETNHKVRDALHPRPRTWTASSSAGTSRRLRGKPQS